MNFTEQIELEVTKNLYDLNQLNDIFGGSTEFLISLACIFINTIPQNSEQMVQAAGEEDWITVSKLAHKIKPTIDSMNMHSITSDIRRLEKDAKNEVNTDTLRKIAERVDKVINTAARQLKYEYNL